jgi:hypothetical protein
MRFVQVRLPLPTTERQLIGSTAQLEAVPMAQAQYFLKPSVHKASGSA